MVVVGGVIIKKRNTRRKKRMIHFFDTEIAAEYGINAAVLLQNIGYWVQQNEANKANFYDGYYWTYNSRKAYQELFPYMSERQISTAFQKLIEAGLVITGNYNKLAYDRTLWYALTQKGESILHFDIMDCSKMSNGLPQNVKPIPDNKPNNKPNIYMCDTKECKTYFTPPTLTEVREYCSARNNNVDPGKFLDFYQANGWVQGRGRKPIKDWKACVRTWEREEKKEEPPERDYSDFYI